MVKILKCLLCNIYISDHYLTFIYNINSIQFDKGNGDTSEMAIMKLYVYNDKLYFGTMNFQSGAGLYVNTDDDGKIFEPLFKNGNGNRMNAYVWYLQEYNNRLYIGTFKMFGEFDLYSIGHESDDIFEIETTTAFGNDNHYGIRSMALYKDKLMIGSATAKLNYACKIFQTDFTDL